jgi:hypothetical protein
MWIATRRSRAPPPSRRRSRADIPSRASFRLRIAGAKSATIALAVAALLGGAQAQTTLGASPGSTYGPTTVDVSAQTAVGDSMATMKTSAAAGNRNTAVSEYETNVKTLFDATVGTVKTAFDDEYSTEFGANWVDGMADAAESATIPAAAKNELIEKTLMDMVTMHLVLDKIDSSTAQADWDAAAAYYIGSTNGFTTYDRAEKRAVDFNTEESSGEASINAAIITALKSPSTTNRDKIIELYQVLYLQNVLKYTYEIDTELAEGDATDLSEVVGEGLAFWRILKPWLKESNAAGAATLDGIFELENIPSSGKPTVQGARHWNYCRAKPIIDAHFATLTAAGVTFGTYTPVTEDGTVCPDTIPTGAESGDYTIAGVTYTFTNDVGASLQFSEAIADIKALLTSGAAMSEVQAKYESSGLKGLADLPREAVSTTYGLFTGNDGHASVTWISDLMTKALASPNTWAPKYSARAEIIEKTLMDALAVQLILDDLEHAIDGDHTLAEGVAFVDHAAAKFLGTATARSSTVFERGNKRGLNYGTTDGTNSDASKAILAALKACAAATTVDLRTAQVEIIKRQIKVIYAQATLRYAKLVGDDIADASAYEEHQAEGMAFFNVIFPWLKASSVSTADIEVLGNFFDVEAAPDSFNDFAYCKTKKAMETFLGADASLMGTLDAADEDGTTCAATLPSGATGVVTDVGTYYPAGGEDIGGSLSFSVAVMKTLDLLDEPSSFADVLDSFRKTGLAGSADTSRVGEPVWDMFKTYFGSPTWMTDYVETVVDNEATPTTNSAAREEMIEKTIRDAVATQAILSDLYRGSQGVTDAHDRYWNHGAAKYIGTQDDRSVTVYNRANKRAANFGTLEGDGETAVANEVAVAALIAGAASGASAATRAAQYEIVKKQILVIYSQCVLRYANYLDGAFIDGSEYADHQAEGQAFWRVIAPFVKEVNANGATFLEGIFDLSRETSEKTHYCRAKAILSDLGVTDAEIGTLEDIRYANCDGVEVPEDATEYLATTGTVSGASRFAAAFSVAAVGAAAVCVFGL